MNLSEPITHLCGFCGFCESPFTAGDRDNLSLISQICADNPINLLNLREPITNLCGIRDSRERLHCKLLIFSDINRASGYIMNNPILAP